MVTFKRPMIPSGVIWLGRNLYSAVCLVDQLVPTHIHHDEATVLRHTNAGYKWEGHRVKHMLRYEPAHILWLTSNNRLRLKDDLLKELSKQMSDRNLVNMMNTEAQELKLNVEVPSEFPPQRRITNLAPPSNNAVRVSEVNATLESMPDADWVRQAVEVGRRADERSAALGNPWHGDSLPRVQGYDGSSTSE